MLFFVSCLSFLPQVLLSLILEYLFSVSICLINLIFSLHIISSCVLNNVSYWILYLNSFGESLHFNRESNPFAFMLITDFGVL